MKQVYKVSDIVYSQDDEQLKELYTLLTENYVEDDDNMFRFDYSPEFLKWSVPASSSSPSSMVQSLEARETSSLARVW